MPFTTLIEAPELAALIEQGSVALFDCSFDLADTAAGEARFAERHLPGAAYLHLDRDLSGTPTGTNGRHPLPDPHVLAARLATLGARREQQIVAYDDGDGFYAARLWWMVKWLGHEDVAVLNGGLAAWRTAGLPLVAGSPDWPDAPQTPLPLAEGIGGAGDFAVGRMPARGITGPDDILRSRQDGSLLVIDARSPARFAGAPDALDPVAGHIPGARNRFYKDNLGADGRFKDATALAAEWSAVIGDTPLDQVVLQCGSGVTATHDLLAMEHAGIVGARLYPGSWSEWIADPSRPVARGDA